MRAGKFEPGKSMLSIVEAAAYNLGEDNSSRGLTGVAFAPRVRSQPSELIVSSMSWSKCNPTRFFPSNQNQRLGPLTQTLPLPLFVCNTTRRRVIA
jgi:hypothetical protein